MDYSSGSCYADCIIVSKEDLIFLSNDMIYKELVYWKTVEKKITCGFVVNNILINNISLYFLCFPYTWQQKCKKERIWRRDVSHVINASYFLSVIYDTFYQTPFIRCNLHLILYCKSFRFSEYYSSSNALLLINFEFNHCQQSEYNHIHRFNNYN